MATLASPPGYTSGSTTAPFGAGVATRDVKPDYLWLPDELVQSGRIAREEIEQAQSLYQSQSQSVNFSSLLVEIGLLSPMDAAVMIAEHYGLDTVNLAAENSIDWAVARLIPADLALRCRAVALRKDGYKLTVAIADPGIPGFATVFRQAIMAAGAREQTVVVAPEADIVARVEDATAESRAVTGDRDRGVFIEETIRKAVDEGASDIHFRPEERMTVIRFRRDGVLSTYLTLPRDLAEEEVSGNWLVGRLFNRGGLNTAKKNVPQDGRGKTQFGSRRVNLRFSTLPVIYGMSIVVRILDQSKGIVPLKQLGMMKDTQDFIHEAINVPYGFTIFVGPTGSGKTTSLYSTLQLVDNRKYAVKTLEDPVEYEFRGIDQTEITDDVTFPIGLRAMMRQDPDYILLGEIRDLETAKEAMRASLTGHVGFSTIHANDSLQGIARLIDIGIEPSVVTMGCFGFVSQRLVRRLCGCSEEDPNSESIAKQWNIPLPVGKKLRRPKKGGCPQCNGIGYKGRIGIYECRPIKPFAALIAAKGTDALPECNAICREEVRSKGIYNTILRSMREEGYIRAIEGITTVAEVVGATSDVTSSAENKRPASHHPVEVNI